MRRSLERKHVRRRTRVATPVMTEDRRLEVTIRERGKVQAQDRVPVDGSVALLAEVKTSRLCGNATDTTCTPSNEFPLVRSS